MEKNSQEVVGKEVKHHIDIDLTIKDVIENIGNGFPSSLKECEESDYLARSRTFLDLLVVFPNKLNQILQTLPSHCKYCHVELYDWKHKGAKSYFLSMGHIKEIKIQLRVCSKCKRAFYPDFYENGLIFLHNKFLVTLELILDLSHILETGGSSIESIKKTHTSWTVGKS